MFVGVCVESVCSCGAGCCSQTRLQRTRHDAGPTPGACRPSQPRSHPRARGPRPRCAPVSSRAARQGGACASLPTAAVWRPPILPPASALPPSLPPSRAASSASAGQQCSTVPNTEWKGKTIVEDLFASDAQNSAQDCCTRFAGGKVGRSIDRPVGQSLHSSPCTVRSSLWRYFSCLNTPTCEIWYVAGSSDGCSLNGSHILLPHGLSCSPRLAASFASQGLVRQERQYLVGCCVADGWQRRSAAAVRL